MLDLVSKLFGIVLTPKANRAKAIRPVFVRFRDSFSNFEITHPIDWHYDGEMAFVDGQYAISFESKDSLSQITICIDTNICPGNRSAGKGAGKKKFNFAEYAKNEIGQPNSGILAPLVKSKFRGMPAYRRSYEYRSGGREYFGGGIMFLTGRLVFSINWSAPKSIKADIENIFKKMLDTMVF